MSSVIFLLSFNMSIYCLLNLFDYFNLSKMTSSFSFLNCSINFFLLWNYFFIMTYFNFFIIELLSQIIDFSLISFAFPAIWIICFIIFHKTSWWCYVKLFVIPINQILLNFYLLVSEIDERIFFYATSKSMSLFFFIPETSS